MVLVRYRDSRPHRRPTRSECLREEPRKLYIYQALWKVPPSSATPSFCNAGLYQAEAGVNPIFPLSATGVSLLSGVLEALGWKMGKGAIYLLAIYKH